MPPAEVPDGASAWGDGVIGTFEFVVARFTARLSGLSDDELFWEPVPGCWSVRQMADGTWAPEGQGDAPPADPPVTTIAWRIAHLACHVLGGFASWLLDGSAPYAGDPDVPHTATGAIAAHERNWLRFREGLGGLTPDGWLAPIGEQFGPHADASTAGLVLHVLDEYVHHTAEVALLRDLYGARPLDAGTAG